MRLARVCLALVPLIWGRIDVGFYHTCGLTDAGAAYCWGLNDRGQLGDGTTRTRPTPAPVAGTHVFRSLTAGGRATCAITVGDSLLCWGSGHSSVDGTSVDSPTEPTLVATGVQCALAATSGDHTCGVTAEGVTYCWGSNAHGQLGVATNDSTCGSVACAREPQMVASAPPFVDLALGHDFSCGLTASDVAYCWEANHDGALGKRADAAGRVGDYADSGDPA